MERLSWIILVGPKCNHKHLYMREKQREIWPAEKKVSGRQNRERLEDTIPGVNALQVREGSGVRRSEFESHCPYWGIGGKAKSFIPLPVKLPQWHRRERFPPAACAIRLKGNAGENTEYKHMLLLPLGLGVGWPHGSPQILPPVATCFES